MPGILILLLITVLAEKCFKAHDVMPYRWQILEGDQWTPLPSNEGIEKDYCDPHNSYR